MSKTKYACTILADSVSARGHRLTTFELTYPRIILPEMLTHRVFSRNTSSSRAIPVEKQIVKVSKHPFVPETFGQNQSGMMAEHDLDENGQELAKNAWMNAVRNAANAAESLASIGAHKQLANRVVEPFTWTTQIVTATDWDNFFTLRLAEDAQPEIRKIAAMMHKAYNTSVPAQLEEGQWHLPLLSEEEYILVNYDGSWEYWSEVSAGRCARVSYLTHDGKRDVEADRALYARLKDSGHFSPLEHVARPFTEREWNTVKQIRETASYAHIYNAFVRHITLNLERVGNIRGWISKRMENEYGM